MPEKTFTQALVERASEGRTVERLWSGSCPIRNRPLFRDLPPSIQVNWAQTMSHSQLQYADDPDLYARAAAAVAEVWDDIKPDFAKERKQLYEVQAISAMYKKKLADQEAAEEAEKLAVQQAEEETTLTAEDLYDSIRHIFGKK